MALNSDTIDDNTLQYIFKDYYGSKLRGHVSITNGYYVLSTIHKTPVKNHKFQHKNKHLLRLCFH